MNASATFLSRGIRAFMRHRARWVVIVAAVVLAMWGGKALAEYCWQYVELAGGSPGAPVAAWECGGTAPATQNIRQVHQNWHCVNWFSDPGYGRAFLGFHKQIISDFEHFRDTVLGLPRIESWTVSPVIPMPFGIPGSDVCAAGATPARLAQCNVVLPSALAGGALVDDPTACITGSGRAANVLAPTSVVLPPQFQVAGGGLASFTTADALGSKLDQGWHGDFHGSIGFATDSQGNSCGDIFGSPNAVNDPMFWRAHSNLDDVHSVWQKLQPTDIMIVLDRSGSMAWPAEPGGTDSRLDAAKDAVEMFAPLIKDGAGHTLGLVSYSSTATGPVDLALTSVNGINMTPTLSGISAGGATGIGAGLVAAQAELDTGTNARKAILLLTDGKENVPPCLSGAGSFCSGTGLDPAIMLGDTQVCVIGYGTEADVDGQVLRTLAEDQAGIYHSFATFQSSSGILSPGLRLKKFFVDCFADIFDSFANKDPFEVLPAGALATDPIAAMVTNDTEITFILAWDDEGDPLELSITTPSGAAIDPSDPAIESDSGLTWHFVRIPLPHLGEGPGQWLAQAVRVDTPGTDQELFITILVAGAARLEAADERFFAYTAEPLIAKVRIKAPYIPADGFDRVEAKVTITRPLVGTGNVLAETGLGRAMMLDGDAIDARTVQLVALDEELGGELVPTVSETFSLYDDGTHGDRFANNSYWTTAVPLAEVEGHYEYHFIFTITEDGVTYQRETVQSVYIEVQIDPFATPAIIEQLGRGPDGRERTKFTFVPMDGIGNVAGPGRPDAFAFCTTGDARVEGEVEEDGFGTYAVTISWTEAGGAPTFCLQQNGRVRMTVLLPEGELLRGLPDIHSVLPEVHVVGDVDCSHTISSVDALFVLQFTASLIDSLPCLEDGDTNDDGLIDAVDAALLLQFIAGLISTLPAGA